MSAGAISSAGPSLGAYGDLPEGIGERCAAHIASRVDDAGLGPGPTLEESAVVRLLIGVVANMCTSRAIAT